MAASRPLGPLTRFGIFVLVTGLVLVLACWGILRYLDDTRRSLPHRQGGQQISPTPGGSAGPSAGASVAQSESAAAVAKLKETVAQALAVLRDPTNPNKKAALDALKAALRGADPKVAVAVIRAFLDSKEDAKTGLPFRLGADHELDDAPTMRTFMMNELGSISLDAKLGDAAEVARTTLATKDSADEWAVAMRNLALTDPDGSRALLAAKSRELIEYAPWQQTPTGGYQEAFDLAAYAGDPTIISDLAPLASTKGVLQQAAQVTMFRLSALAPEQVANYLNNNTTALANDPMHRADYMGNLDLSSPTQLAQAEAYLARGDVTDKEKEKFIGRLGLQAAFVSNTLATPEDIPQMPVIEHRALTNRVAQGWLASGNYPTLQPALQQVITYTQDGGVPPGP